jgi:hypothetical protein
MPIPRDPAGPLRIYKLFLSHAWDYDDDYDRLVKLLNNAQDFHWRNLSVPSNDRIHHLSTGAEIRAALAFYINKADCVLICAGMYCAHREWIQAEIDIARELGKPIIGIELWGQERTPTDIQDSASRMVGWSTESIVSAVRDICPAVAPRLLQISFTVTATVNQEAIDFAVGQISLDWYRYAWNCYFSWTTLETGTICTHIRQVAGLEHAYVVVCALREDDGHANLSFSMWNWLRDKV